MTGRFNFTLLFLLSLFAVILLKLFYWQVVKGQELFELGLSQYGTTITLNPLRGEIRTSDNFPIAANKTSYLVYANPKLVKDKEKTIKILSETLKVNIASASASLNKDLFWVPIAHKVDTKVKDNLERLQVLGIGFEKEYSRFYPEASMAAHLLGFVGKDENGRDKGYFGVEGYYDRLLRGKEGVAVQVHDAFGKPILSKINPRTPQINGSSLILSIQRPVQFLVEKRLKEGIEKYGATSGMAGVMDPKTGNILALASFPSFDPKNYQDFSADLFKNPFVSNRYEPGSTFKPVVMSSALDSGAVKADTKCPVCSGPVEVGGFEIRTWNNKYYKDTNMVEVIQHSDNTGMVYISQKLGVDKMLSYFEKFGVGGATGIDLQGESVPTLKPRNSWYKADLATASFGQGISVTAIELLDAIGAIANQGKRMEPHIVSAIETKDGKVIKVEPKTLSSPVSPKTAKIMTEMMVNAVNKGEASWTRLKGYRVAGKTGTASIPIQGHYDPNSTITSFVGFGPADDPKFVMLVVLNKPTTSIYGSETAAPIFFQIAKDLFNLYNIAPGGE